MEMLSYAERGTNTISTQCVTLLSLARWNVLPPRRDTMQTLSNAITRLGSPKRARSERFLSLCVCFAVQENSSMILKLLMLYLIRQHPCTSKSPFLISGFCHDVDQICALLGCYAVPSGNTYTTAASGQRPIVKGQEIQDFLYH
jgi:hypothetical protein